MLTKFSCSPKTNYLLINCIVIIFINQCSWYCNLSGYFLSQLQSQYIHTNVPWEEENMPAVREWVIGWTAVRVVILIPSTEKQIHRHITGKHIHASLTKHAVKRHAHAASGLYIWGLAGCSLCKIIARCSQSTMDSGRGMVGETSKVNTRLI